MRVDAARDQDPVAPRRAAGHQGRLGGRRRAVVVRGGDDVEVDQLGQQRFVLVDALERALADLGLVRRVGRVPLAAQQQLVDGRRAPVAVDAGAQERGEIGPVARGEAGQPRRELELGLGIGEVERRRPQRDRDVVEQLVDRGQAERREHPRAVVGGMGTVGHRPVSRPRSARRRRPASSSASTWAGSARRSRIIQPPPNGSLLTSSGLGAEVGVGLGDLAAERGEQVADGLDRLDHAEGRELVERRGRRSGSSTKTMSPSWSAA